MTRRHTKRLVMSTAVAATAACTALVTLPAFALISTSSPATPAATVAGVTEVSGPVLRPALTDHLAEIGRRTPVRVMVQADGSTAAAERAVRQAGLVRELTLDEVGIVVAVGRKAAVRDLRGTAATRVDWADEEMTTYSNTSHEATRAREVQEGALDVDADGLGDELDGAGYTVAVVDSGTDGTHPMFLDEEGESRVKRNVKIACSDAVNILTPQGARELDECAVDATAVNDTDSPSIGGHGTHVTGIAAGKVVTDSAGRELRGAAPAADILAVSTGATLSIYGGTLGMYWVLQHHDDPCASQVLPTLPQTCAPVVAVNNSWGPTGGGTFDAGAPQVVVQRALVDAGVTVVWASGNDGGDGSEAVTNPYSTDPTPGVLSVANYDDAGSGARDNALNSSSSRGARGTVSTYPDLSAPGTDITSACRAAPPAWTSRTPTTTPSPVRRWPRRTSRATSRCCTRPPTSPASS